MSHVSNILTLLFCLLSIETATAQGNYSFISDDAGNPNALVFDNKTSLTWQRCTVGQTWSNSTSSCSGAAKVFTSQQQALTFSKNTGSWRLPNIKELSSLIDLNRVNLNEPVGKVIDTTAFPGTLSNNYISSTPIVESPYFFWTVNFSSGFFHPAIPENSSAGPNYLRLIR